MTNEQLFSCDGPFDSPIVVVFGVFLNGRQIEGVRREIDSLRQELRVEIRAAVAEPVHTNVQAASPPPGTVPRPLSSYTIPVVRRAAKCNPI